MKPQFFLKPYGPLPIFERLYKEFGLTTEAVVAAAKESIAAAS